jgi:nicotinamidase-related amidase
MDIKFAVVTNDLQVAAANVDPDRQAAVDAFMPRQVAFLQQMRQLDVPVIHMQLIVSDDDPRNEGTPDELRFTRGSKGSAMLPEVLAPNDLVLPKPKDSGFFETELDATLKELGVQAIVITGMQAQICVQTTAADAHFRGYGVLVPSDCVVSTRADDVERALQWLASYCATVLTSEQIVQLMENGSIEIEAEADEDMAVTQ